MPQTELYLDPHGVDLVVHILIDSNNVTKSPLLSSTSVLSPFNASSRSANLLSYFISSLSCYSHFVCCERHHISLICYDLLKAEA